MDENRSRRLIFLGHLPEALKRCGGRHYALSGTPEEIALCALLAEWQAQRHESFTHDDCAAFLAQLKPFAPSLFQDRPEPEQELHVTAKVKDLVQQYTDPITGSLAFENPWAREHKNLSARMEIAKDHPELAEHLKRVAKGVTYSEAKKERQAKAERDAARSIEYGSEQHAKNPYKNGSSLTQLTEFRARVGDQVANFWQREAREKISLPWLPNENGQPTNMTQLMKMQRENPKLRELIDKSQATAKEWAQTDIMEGEREAAAALARQAAAKALLGAKK
jgi:hypothetical protein